MNLPSRAAARLIVFYQKYISARRPYRVCRFYPTCSQYALDALKEWGFFRGILLALWRVLRCNPLCKGGIDYVPENPARH